MASLNKGSSQKDILNDGINILAVNVEQNDKSDSDVNKDSTNDKYTKTDNKDERNKLIILHKISSK